MTEFRLNVLQNILRSIVLGVLGTILTLILLDGGSTLSLSNVQATTKDTVYTHSLFLPFVASTRPCLISGQATLHGQPVAGAVFKLLAQHWEGSSIFEVARTTTNDQGDFCIVWEPDFVGCRAYFYRLVFSLQDQPDLDSKDGYAQFWSKSLPLCTTSPYTGIQAELSDIEIITPLDNITVTLPVTFSWRHSEMENGRYGIRFYTACDFPEQIDVGFTKTAVITEVSDCVATGEPVSWFVTGYGGSTQGFVSSQYHTITIKAASAIWFKN